MSETFVLLAVLTTSLGDERFAVREAASKGIAELGVLALLHLEVAVSSPDPEVRCRAERLLVKVRVGRMDAISVADLPWIDSLPGEYPERCQVVSVYLSLSGSSADKDWHGYKQATAYWLRDQLVAGRTWGELEQVLVQMRERVRHYRQHGRYPSTSDAP